MPDQDIRQSLKSMATVSLKDDSNESEEARIRENAMQQSPVESLKNASHEPEFQQSHQRLVFADPAAFRYVNFICLDFISHMQ